VKLSKNDTRVLALLFKSDRLLDSFTIYKRLRMIYGELINSISNLSEKGFLKEVNNKYKITLDGKEKLLKYKNNYLISGKKVWREVPIEYLQPSISPHDLYIPKIFWFIILLIGGKLFSR
jgi:predicted transcriptional regulator